MAGYRPKPLICVLLPYKEFLKINKRTAMKFYTFLCICNNCYMEVYFSPVYYQLHPPNYPMNSERGVSRKGY